MKVIKFFWASRDAKYLGVGGCLESVVRTEIDRWDFYKDSYNLLIGKTENEYGDLLYQMQIDCGFLKGVNRLDVIKADCFYSEKEDVKQFIDFLNDRDIYFIIKRKIYIKEGLDVVFEVCHHDSIDECLQYISNPLTKGY